MSRNTRSSITSTARLFLVLFLLLPFTFLLAPILIAQGDNGEPPIIPLDLPELPLLSLAAAPVTLDTFPAPTTPLTVTLPNQGTEPATISAYNSMAACSPCPSARRWAHLRPDKA